MSDQYPRKKSLVDYSKISDRPVQDARFEKAARGSIAPQMPERAAAAAAAVGAASAPRMSTQMEAVMRLMTGRQERTISEKLADANRPTWEAYKKENEDKLNMEGADEEKMEQYRRELDAQRDKLLARASGREDKKRKKKKKRRRHESSDSDSSSESSESGDSQDHKRRKKHRKKHKKKRRHHRRDDDSDSEGSDRKRTGRKKHSKKRKKREESGEESDGSHYKLSRFFAEGTENNS